MGWADGTLAPLGFVWELRGISLRKTSQWKYVHPYMYRDFLASLLGNRPWWRKPVTDEISILARDELGIIWQHGEIHPPRK